MQSIQSNVKCLRVIFVVYSCKHLSRTNKRKTFISYATYKISRAKQKCFETIIVLVFILFVLSNQINLSLAEKLVCLWKSINYHLGSKYPAVCIKKFQKCWNVIIFFRFNKSSFLIILTIYSFYYYAIC